MVVNVGNIIYWLNYILKVSENLVKEVVYFVFGSIFVVEIVKVWIFILFLLFGSRIKFNFFEVFIK